MERSKPKVTTVKARGSWHAPMQVEGKAGEFDVTMDEPEFLGGTNTGPSPMELVASALIGCAGITLTFVAREMDFKFNGATFEAEGDIDLRGFMGEPGVCRHFCAFRGTFVIDTEESRERLDEVRDQVESRCPVFNMFADAGVQSEIEWRKKS